MTQTLDAGEDVIVGYVLTNETSGDTKNPNYVNTPDNRPNKIVNGHEITIVDAKTGGSGLSLLVFLAFAFKLLLLVDVDDLSFFGGSNTALGSSIFGFPGIKERIAVSLSSFLATYSTKKSAVSFGPS